MEIVRLGAIGKCFFRSMEHKMGRRSFYGQHKIENYFVRLNGFDKCENSNTTQNPIHEHSPYLGRECETPPSIAVTFDQRQSIN